MEPLAWGNCAGESAHRRLAKLTNLPAPLDVKVHLINGAIYPTLLFGMELAPLGTQHIDKIRSKISDALLGGSRSRNPALATLVTPKLVDPFVALLKHVFGAVRTFLVRSSETVRQAFFHRVAVHSGSAAKCKGPAGVLKYYLNKLNWDVDKQGFLRVTSFIRIHLLHHSKQCLFRWIQRTWESTVLSDHTRDSAHQCQGHPGSYSQAPNPPSEDPDQRSGTWLPNQYAEVKMGC